MTTQVFGWVGLLLVLLAYEKAGYAGWRIWLLGLTIGLLAWVLDLIVKSRAIVSKGLATEAAEARRRKWLPGKKRK